MVHQPNVVFYTSVISWLGTEVFTTQAKMVETAKNKNNKKVQNGQSGLGLLVNVAMNHNEK
ncbi:hypothetical protein EYF80_010293 [Liparis tanakae]|uniref:Uncharacterized protein n=1 Tax=Liparis tanakae TaxID=230148 RepID=A0A4Z2IN84_9TELE|nr:hypothetical protein EYF80_010293 [Liparis tanakae]